MPGGSDRMARRAAARDPSFGYGPGHTTPSGRSDGASNAGKCPFCGGRADIKRPKLDVIKKMSAEAYGLGGSVETRRMSDIYYKCNGCTMEFVHAEREIESILVGLEIGEKVPNQIKRCYSGSVSAIDLLTEHRTAIVRKANNYLSFISAHIVKDEQMICFCYNNVRTYGTFVKKSKKSSNGDYYLFEKLNKA